MKIEWNKVTWYSKLTAVVLVVVIFSGGIYGILSYKKQLSSVVEHQLIKETPTTIEIKLPEGYTTKDGKVYFEGLEVLGADPEMFTMFMEITNQFGADFLLAKDSENIYFKGMLIDGGYDVSTLKYISDFYFKDARDVYKASPDPHLFRERGGSLDWVARNIEKPGQESFIILDRCESSKTTIGLFAKNKNSVYCDGRRLPNADPTTFEVIGMRGFSNLGIRIYEFAYSKDEKHVYQASNLIRGADPKTFIPLEEGYSKDAIHVYYKQMSVPKADPKTFEVIESEFLSELYLGGRGGVDSTPKYTLPYGKDKAHIFTKGKLVPPDEIESFMQKLQGELACLAGGTKILMADGSYRNIEDIQVGDSVTSFDIETGGYKVAEVNKVIKRKDPLVIINEILKAAPDEPVYMADRTIKEAIDINIGDYLLNEGGSRVRVNTIMYNTEVVDTYDFTLKDANNFFADGYLVRTPNL